MIDTFRAVRQAGIDAELHLGGPASGPEVQQLVDGAIEEFQDRLVYYGAVYGEDKQAFFNRLDLFIFPTRYRVEVQPLVICEAMRCSVPVIAHGLACIPELLGDSGMSVPPDDDFPATTVQQVQQWVDSPDRFRQSKLATFQRSTFLRDESQEKMDEFLNRFIRNGHDQNS